MTNERLELLLADLGSTLDELASVQQAKQSALANLNSDGLQVSSQAEGRLAERLSAATTASPGQNDLERELPRKSLNELIRGLPESEREPLLARFAGIRERARSVKQHAIANWLALYRTNQHVGQLLELIRRAGRPAVSHRDGNAGLVLDSTA